MIKQPKKKNQRQKKKKRTRSTRTSHILLSSTLFHRIPCLLPLSRTQLVLSDLFAATTTITMLRMPASAAAGTGMRRSAGATATTTARKASPQSIGSRFHQRTSIIASARFVLTPTGAHFLFLLFFSFSSRRKRSRLHASIGFKTRKCAVFVTAPLPGKKKLTLLPRSLLLVARSNNNKK